tara:strand:+ start:842 stop:1744 length:903 start_codon:yes stop_codon:yes gene_type:complete
VKCIECGSHDSTFDDILGEKVCDACGLVLMVTPLEETSSNTVYENRESIGRETVSRLSSLGSVISRSGPMNRKDHLLRRTERYNSSRRDKYHIEIMMSLSYYNVSNEVKEDAIYMSNYLRQRHKHLNDIVLFSNAIAFIAMRKRHLGITTREHARNNDLNVTRLNRSVKKLMRGLGGPIRPREIIIPNEIRKIVTEISKLKNGIDLTEDNEFISECIINTEGIKKVFQDTTFTTSYVLTGIWLTSVFMNKHLTQKQLYQVSTMSEVTIRNTYQRILKRIGFDRDKIKPQYYLHFKEKLII